MRTRMMKNGTPEPAPKRDDDTREMVSMQKVDAKKIPTEAKDGERKRPGATPYFQADHKSI